MAQEQAQVPTADLDHDGIIDAFVRNPLSRTASPLIEYYRRCEDPVRVAELALTLSDSGQRLRFPGKLTADIASTGGPTSLSTLLCPLFLVLADFTVPKLGVQGRPAGGIDVMARVPGFDISPSPDTVRSIVEQCRFAHFLADDKYAPLDQTLFRFRQDLDAQAVRNLVVASILAKKIAAGVECAGLEVRVFPGGNFGENVRVAVENARFFVKVAERLKINATCFVTDCSVPYQPLIGRGEAIMALHALFYGGPSPWLVRHAKQCWGFVRRMCQQGEDSSDFGAILRQAGHVWEQHLRAHGASPNALPILVAGLNSQPQHTIRSPGDGFVVYNLVGIRDFIVQQQRAATGNRFPDPAGVELLKHPQERVARGEPVLKIRQAVHLEPSLVEGRLFSIAAAPAMPFEEQTIGASCHG